MPKRDLIVWLDDIDRMVRRIEEMQNDISDLETFTESTAYQLAFERGYEVIGEALYQIRKDFDTQGITDIDKIISLRHLLAHEYFKVNHKLLWAFTTDYLPLLKTQIRQKLHEEKIRIFGSSDPKLDL
jgi:uncharacterized protein with HEPN domain